MFPILFQFGPVVIYSYPVLVALGCCLGLLWTVKEANRSGIRAWYILDLFFYMAIGSLIGARLFFVVLSWGNFKNDLVSILYIWQGGLFFHGGLLAAIIVAVIYARINEIKVLILADVLAPGMALAQAVGRIGCLAVGCCYGRHTELPWAITFTDNYSLAPLGQALHPTQAYSSMAMFALFLFLLIIRKYKYYFVGSCFFTYLFCHGLFRLLIEPLRADFRGDLILGMVTTTQLLSLFFMISSISIMILLLMKKNNS